MPEIKQLNKRILVTGAASGLGKHCVEYFNADGIIRTTPWKDVLIKAKEQPYDAIIHAAYNTNKNITTKNLSAYLEDTLWLTQMITCIPVKKFIFISTVDVYPHAEVSHHEEEVLPLKADNVYGMSKIICENIVMGSHNDWLVIRPTALLGLHAKKNSLMKILENKPLELTLSAQSSFNYILHDDVCHFIEHAIQSDLKGIYNLASTHNVTLQEIVETFTPDNPIKFGQYTYQTGNIANQKASAVLSDLNRSSLETVQLFLQKMTTRDASHTA